MERQEKDRKKTGEREKKEQGERGDRAGISSGGKGEKGERKREGEREEKEGRQMGDGDGSMGEIFYLFIYLCRTMILRMKMNRMRRINSEWRNSRLEILEK